MTALLRLALNALLALGLAAPGAALAQAYPAKAIRWVVAYPPGGGTDMLARTVGAQLAKQLNQPVVVDNRPGGAGIIGTEHVARSPADGYTVFTADNGTLVYNSALYKTLPYDPVKDFAPVSLMGRFPLVLLTSNDSPFTSATQLVEQARRQPGKLNYASPGIGSPHHLAMELLKQEAGLFVVHIPYRGSGGAIQDLLGGQINLFVADSAAALPLVRGGKARALAVFSGARSASLAQVPTWKELGHARVEAYGWQGLVVPAGTPPEIVQLLSRELGAALRSAEVSRRLADFGIELIPGEPQEMARYLQAERAIWPRLIRERGITAE